jgi:hypothetical protein
MNFYYGHIYIGVWTSVIVILLYIYVILNEMCVWIWFELKYVPNVSSLIAVVRLVVAGG